MDSTSPPPGGEPNLRVVRKSQIANFKKEINHRQINDIYCFQSASHQQIEPDWT